MANHLTNENSPYLLQHASNPVDWYPWGDEALEKARLQGKPIFLSIGYAACHWCHVMAHESFEDPETAEILNRDFVCIKVDREQRPDLDSIYMQATTALTGSGGWPMSVFLTPDLRPFYAGTYFPNIRRHGLPAFIEVLGAVADAWRDDRQNIEGIASNVERSLKSASETERGTAPNRKQLEAATTRLLQSYDWEHGGWGAAPKFPQPMAIEYLLRQASALGETTPPLSAALHALRAMARGGMYDVVGGGFSRYSTDINWHVPHFEKMLYDNAQLARTYLHAWQITREPFFKRIFTETLDFVERELACADGGFYSSLDADSEGQEGKFYLWTADEILRAIRDPALLQVFSSAYGVTNHGDSQDGIILQRALDDGTLAAKFKIAEPDVELILASCHKALLGARGARVRPSTDDKVLASWNGLMLRAYAEAAAAVDDPARSQQYLSAATRSAAFLLHQMRPDGHLRRTWRKGQTGNEVFLEDYGAVILALIQLYQVDFNNVWYAEARDLAEEMLERFAAPEGGFYDTPRDGAPILLRPRDLQDSASPSGGAMAVEALLYLADLDGSKRYRAAADAALAQVTELASMHPTAFAHWLSAEDRALSGGLQIAILHPASPVPRSMLAIVRQRFRPNAVLAASAFPPTADAPRLLLDRGLMDSGTTAFVCRDFVCKLPVTTPEQLADQLQM